MYTYSILMRHTHTYTGHTKQHPRGAVEDQRAETRGYPLGSLSDWGAVGGRGLVPSRMAENSFQTHIKASCPHVKDRSSTF